jgi:hypothetical protein
MSNAKKRLLPLVLLAILAAACSQGNGTTNAEDAAMREAKSCYEALYLKGEPEVFLDGHANASAMPQEYREQLTEALRHHLRSVGSDRQGVTAVKVLNAEMDSSLQVMQVFLSLTYGNDTQEKIVVPMVRTAPKGKWMLK